MNYYLCNITVKDSTVKELFRISGLNNVPYGSLNKLPNGHFEFLNILLKQKDINFTENKTLNGWDLMCDKIYSQSEDSLIYTLLKLIEKMLNKNKTPKYKNMSINDFLEKTNFDVFMTAKITDDDFDIFYTDGSSENISGKPSGYASILLTDDENLTLTKKYDYLTEKEKSYIIYSGGIESGTNNMAEMKAVQTALENMTDKNIQVILADSDLSMKIFREYYKTWKNNNWIKPDKKAPANLDILLESVKLLEESNKIILFGWVPGHEKDAFGTIVHPFNFLCDEVAKNEKEKIINRKH